MVSSRRSISPALLLQLQGIANLVRMETRNENVEGCNAVSIRDLIRTALRMRPDRIIVGEVRGGEAPFYQPLHGNCPVGKTAYGYDWTVDCDRRQHNIYPAAIRPETFR